MTDPREKKYECSWCRQRFYTEHYMQSHMQKLHRKSVQHQCQLCSQRFTLLTCLSIHTAKVHSSSNSSKNNNNNNPSSSINNNNNNNNNNSNNNTKNYIDDDDDGCNNFVDVGKGGFEKKETERQRVSGEKRENSNEEGGGEEGLNHRERKRRTRMEKRKKRRRYNEAEDSDGGDQVTLASLITQRDSNHKNKPITNTTTTTTLTHDDYDDDAIDKETGVHKETLEHMMCKLIDGVKYWICKVCHNAKLCCTKMAIHVETKHLNAPERSKRHVCEVCGKRFRIPKSLRTHMTVHDDVPPLNFRCKYCPAAYRSRSTLDEHIAKKHEGSSRLCCMLCGFCCNVYIQLMRHMRYEHAF